MRIIELGDYSMVIMKDSEDRIKVSIGDFYRFCYKNEYKITVEIPNTRHHQMSDDCIYSGGRLILFFKDKVLPEFKLHQKVLLGYM